MLDLLYQFNPWWEGDFPQIQFKQREKYMSVLRQSYDQKQIVFMSGLRRVGKTTLMKLILKDLVDQKDVAPNRVFYVSLDDYLLKEYNIIEILSEFRKIHQTKIDEKIYVFLDEITYKKAFHIQLKNIYDSQNVKIFAASSS